MGLMHFVIYSTISLSVTVGPNSWYWLQSELGKIIVMRLHFHTTAKWVHNSKLYTGSKKREILRLLLSRFRQIHRQDSVIIIISGLLRRQPGWPVLPLIDCFEIEGLIQLQDSFNFLAEAGCLKCLQLVIKRWPPTDSCRTAGGNISLPTHQFQASVASLTRAALRSSTWISLLWRSGFKLIMSRKHAPSKMVRVWSLICGTWWNAQQCTNKSYTSRILCIH